MASSSTTTATFKGQEDSKTKLRSVKSVAVLGGGISGLAAAYKLKSNGLDVTLFEAEERVGGKLKSVSRDGLIWDEGANTMLESEMEVTRILDNAGLRGKQQFSHFGGLVKIEIFWFDRLEEATSRLREAMVELLQPKPPIVGGASIAQRKTPVVIDDNKKKEGTSEAVVLCLERDYKCHQQQCSPRWACDKQVQGSPHTNSFGTVFSEHQLVAGTPMRHSGFGPPISHGVRDFFERHFGKEVVDYLIDPFVAATSAADLDSVSMPHAFPELWNLEKTFGSVIVGAIRSKLFGQKEKKGKMEPYSGKKNAQSGPFSFHGGMQSLANMLCKELGDGLKLNSKVLSLSCSLDENSISDNWSVSYATNHKKPSPDQSFDAVIMTAPLCNVKEMKILRRGYPFMLDFLPEVNYMPLTVVITAYKKENVRRPLEGFGVLIPSIEKQTNGYKTLGTSFSSMMFPDRAPSDVHLYTTFVGGSQNKDLAKASVYMILYSCECCFLISILSRLYCVMDELKEVVASDLGKLLGAQGEPAFFHCFYWSKAFPLYGHDYNSVLRAIEKMEESLPGFFYAGNHRGGLSVDNALASGCKAADLVISYLNSSSEDKLHLESKALDDETIKTS
ncbi:hypothetical protein IFM89_002467 [Coptis chinensis]|uniref:Amine oxidase domain-containing protein n=1 Tax=Coptis chinensis TaxID=261450 RepID=A0A835LQN7_9MAGN|nr:hypothetical protein IFM89_002467 [Coptis chinensis]